MPESGPLSDLDTLTMARVYLDQGKVEEAAAIYDRLVDSATGDARQIIELREIVERSLTGAAAARRRADEAPAELPPCHGRDLVALVPLGPGRILCAWEATPRGRAAAAAQLAGRAGDQLAGRAGDQLAGRAGDQLAGRAGDLTLRLVTATPGAAAGRDARDLTLEGDAGEVQVEVSAGGFVCAAVGLVAADGSFAPVAHSEVLQLPGADAAAAGRSVALLEVEPARGGLDHEPPLPRLVAWEADGLGPAASSAGGTGNPLWGSQSTGPASGRLVALCVRAAAPPPERGRSATDAATRAVRETTRSVHRLLERVAAGPEAAVVLALAPAVTAALADDDLELLRDLEAHARIETCVTGATDAWLPGMGGVGQRAQVGAAAAEHRRRLLRQPLGLWPRDLALPHGLHARLAAAGFRWALVPARALELGRPPAAATTPVFFPSGLAAFGARPWRAAEWASAAAVAGRPALAVVTAEITEADAALEWAAAQAETITPAAYLRRYPRNPVGAPAPLAGADEAARGPYADPARAGMVRHLRQLEAAMARVTSRSRAFAPAPGLRRRALRQAAREALLAAAADWASDAAGAARFRAHASRCSALCGALGGASLLDAAYLSAVEARDGVLFEDVEAELFAGEP